MDRPEPISLPWAQGRAFQSPRPDHLEFSPWRVYFPFIARETHFFQIAGSASIFM